MILKTGKLTVNAIIPGKNNPMEILKYSIIFISLDLT